MSPVDSPSAASSEKRSPDDDIANITELLRPELRGMTPYGAPQLDVPVRLNVNENPYPLPEALVTDVAVAVAEATRGLNRYPDRDALALRAGLAEFLYRDSDVRLAASQVWAANGSNEVMLQLLQTFGGPGRSVLGFAPTYSMYPDYCRDTFTEWVTVPRRADFSLDLDAALAAVREVRPAVILLASPNNPTGTATSLTDVEALYDATDGLLVVDEAYAEFRRDGVPSALTLLAGRRRLVVTRTMSKAFSLAGARLGYLAADAAVVDAVQLVRLPYHLSATTQAVARTALAHADMLLAEVAAMRRDRDALVDWLRSRDLEVAETDANFVLFGHFADRHAVWSGLLERGVLIREVGPQGWLRVSVGTPGENEAFRAALSEVLSATAHQAPPSGNQVFEQGVS